jgi:hypothetical protein
MTYTSISLLVWLAAATLAHGRAYKQDEDHIHVFAAIGSMLIFSALAIGLEGARGIIPILVTLALPSACVYGIAGACKAGARHVVGAWVVTSVMVWLAAQIHPTVYPWAVFAGWAMMATAGWITVLDPYERPEGLTQVSAFALAASLLADLPGVYAWVRTGRWYAEGALSVVSAVALATLPTLWRLRTSKRSC